MLLYEETLSKLSGADEFLITLRPSVASSVTEPGMKREISRGRQSFNIFALDESEMKPPSASQPRRQTSTKISSDYHLDSGASPIEKLMRLRWTLSLLSGYFDKIYVTLREVRVIVKA